MAIACRYTSGPKKGQFKKQSLCRRAKRSKTIQIRRSPAAAVADAAIRANVACQRRAQAKENLALAEQVAVQQDLDVKGFYDIERLGSMMRNFFNKGVALSDALRAFATAGSRVGLTKTMADDVSADDYCRVQVFLLVLVINALVAEFGGPGGPLSSLRADGIDPINRMPDLSGCSGLSKSQVAAFWGSKWRLLAWRAEQGNNRAIAVTLKNLAKEFTLPNSGQSVLEPSDSGVATVIKQAIAESDGSDDAKLLTFVLDQMAGPDGLPAGSQEQAQAGSIGLRLLKGLLLGGAVAGAGYAASQYMAPGLIPMGPGLAPMGPEPFDPLFLPTSGSTEALIRAEDAPTVWGNLQSPLPMGYNPQNKPADFSIPAPPPAEKSFFSFFKFW